MSSSLRVLLAIVLSVGILLLWQYFFAPRVTQEQKTEQKTEQRAEQRAEQPASQPSASEKAQPAKPPSVRPAPPIRTTKVTTPRAVGVFTSQGAALKSWTLTDPRFKEKIGGQWRPVNLVRIPRTSGPWPLATTFYGASFKVDENASFRVVRESPREVLYRWESDKLRIDKHYVVDRTRPLVWLTVTVRNLTAAPLRYGMKFHLYDWQDPREGTSSFTNPYPMISTVLCYVNGELFQRSPAAIAGEDSGCSAGGCGMGSGPVTRTGEMRWIGAGNRYFLTAVVPLAAEEDRRCELRLLDGDIVEGIAQLPETVIQPKASATRKFTVFAGAKDLGSLDAVRGPEGQDPKISESIEYGWFAVLCRPMLWLLKVFESWFGNWGLAIIMLTIVVKLLTLPWTQKSMRSMKEMQRLKPKMDELRAKYGNDKQRLNQEMMALYKLHKVNPLGGCLPMLIQMPIWFALYRTLGNAVELYHSNFVLWITDLTAPDPYYILPIAMGISMYVQQAITPQAMEGAQAKMMKYVMPGIFTAMMLALPSGLTLYIFVNTVLTMIHQWYMNRSDPDRQPGAKAEHRGAEPRTPGPRAAGGTSRHGPHALDGRQAEPDHSGGGPRPRARRRRKR